MAKFFEWYVTQDEGRWTLAAAATRDEAVAFGRNEYNGEGFMVCEASKSEIDFEVDVLNELEGINEERVDPDGDGVFMKQPTNEQEKELSGLVAEVIKAWAEKHELLPTSWAFAEQRCEETIEAIAA